MSSPPPDENGGAADRSPSPAPARSRSRSPKDTSPPPRSKSLSRSRSRSRKRSASPPRRSPSPRRRSPSPRRRSPSPRRRSISPRRRSLSPRRRSPSPRRRRRSPSPRRSRGRDRSRSRDRGYGGGYGGRAGGGFGGRGRDSGEPFDGRPKGPRPTPPRAGTHMFVAGLNFISTERDVEKKFGKYGRVREVRIVRHPRTYESRGFGFVQMDTDDDVDRVIRHLDGRDWNGRILLVERARNARM